MVDIPAASLAGAVASLLYALLGIAVLAAAPRASGNRAFALFAVFSGLAGMLDRLFLPIGLARSTYFALAAPLYAVTVVGIVALAFAFPEPPARQERRSVRYAFAIGIALAGLHAWAWARWFDDWSSPVAAYAAAWGLVTVVGAAGATFFAFRATGAPRLLPSYAAMALAVYLPAALGIGNSFDGGSTEYMVSGAVIMSVVVLAWLRTAVVLKRAAWAVAVVWASLGAALVAQLTDTGPTAWDATVGVVRFLAIALLAFMILRGQVQGLEKRVRWTVSRSTIAGAFLASFFIASEGTQIIFGSENPWAGLLAAGALVFAIAPLQRAAERLAEKAVPSSAASVPPGAPTEARKNPEEVFRKVLRMAMRDGRLSADERVHLAEVAEAFGLSAGRAAALVRDAEQDSGVTE